MMNISLSRLIATLTVLLVFSGCGSRELLLPRSADNTGSVSFAGNWRMQQDRIAMARQINQAIRQTSGMREEVFRQRRSNSGNGNNPAGSSGGRSRSSGGLVHVFLVNGATLKITQTPSAIFISFDRAVVEEFRFGEHREISTGQVVAQRVSGWDDASYIVETLDRNNMKLTERFSLSADGKVLTRLIVLRDKADREVSVLQTFSRQP
jgi:hypothetical protein